MPSYVPYHKVVERPVKLFRKQFANCDMGNRDMSIGEYATKALEGNLEFYRGVIIQSPGYNFYSHAPNDLHWVVDLEGNECCLRTEEERRSFYSNLPQIEKEEIRKSGSDLASLL